MRIKNYFLITLFTLFTSILSYSQATLNKEEISKLDKLQKELYLKVEDLNNLRKLRIQNFLNNNSQYSEIFKDSNDKVFVIYDIVDNKPIYRTTDNNLAALATGTNHLQEGGSMALDLDGTGMLVGVWDGGPVQDTHTEFLNKNQTNTRITNIESLNTSGNTDLSAHATHVSGTISARGANASARGMATNVNIRTYNFNDDTIEMVSALADVSNPLILSNHSYGVPVEQGNGTLDAWFMGAYTQSARTVDEIAIANPNYLIVMSAGNSGNTVYSGGLYADSDKLTGDKTAKNNLVVANANPIIDPFTNQLTAININSSSSQGPTDDIRIKPDIAGDGTGLLSPVPGDGYSVFSGTSMAAPNVTGSLVLLQQYYEQLNSEYMNSSTLKGLVCHTAQDDASISGPDHKFGWGLLNAKEAAELIQSNNIGAAIINEFILNNGETHTYTFSVQSGEKLKATICWTDVPGVVLSGAANLNNQTPRLVNDLDIRLSKDGITYFPWRLNYDPVGGFSNSKEDNNVDNIEVVEIDSPTTGTYTLTVTHKGNLLGPGTFDPPLQNYSLIVSGNNLSLSIDENDLAKNLSVYPNPSNGEFTISFQSNPNSINNKVMIEVYDLQGRLVYDNDYENSSSIFEEKILLDSVKAGVYILNVSEGNRITSKKLIIE